MKVWCKSEKENIILHTLDTWPLLLVNYSYYSRKLFYLLIMLVGRVKKIKKILYNILINVLHFFRFVKRQYCKALSRPDSQSRQRIRMQYYSIKKKKKVLHPHSHLPNTFSLDRIWKRGGSRSVYGCVHGKSDRYSFGFLIWRTFSISLYTRRSEEQWERAGLQYIMTGTDFVRMRMIHTVQSVRDSMHSPSDA